MLFIGVVLVCWRDGSLSASKRFQRFHLYKSTQLKKLFTELREIWIELWCRLLKLSLCCLFKFLSKTDELNFFLEQIVLIRTSVLRVFKQLCHVPWVAVDVSHRFIHWTKRSFLTCFRFRSTLSLLSLDSHLAFIKLNTILLTWLGQISKESF